MEENDKLIVCNIIGVIDLSLVKGVISKIEALNLNDIEGVCLRINSQGGSIPLALILAEYLYSLPCRVLAYNMAHCDSAAILVFAAAKERIAIQSSSFMFHPPFVNLNGKFTFRGLAVELKRLREDTKSMITFLSKIIPIDKSTLLGWIGEGEHILSARQAVKMGIATMIEPMVN